VNFQGVDDKHFSILKSIDDQNHSLQEKRHASKKQITMKEVGSREFI
jgi:hypothetical protein